MTHGPKDVDHEETGAGNDSALPQSVETENIVAKTIRMAMQEGSVFADDFRVRAETAIALITTQEQVELLEAKDPKKWGGDEIVIDGDFTLFDLENDVNDVLGIKTRGGDGSGRTRGYHGHSDAYPGGMDLNL